MPGGDRTGPMGGGAMTGGGFGYCGGAGHPLYFSQRGFGRGFGNVGRGGGWRHRFWASGRPGWFGYGGWQQPQWSVADERRALERDAEALEAELELIRARIEELGTASPE